MLAVRVEWLSERGGRSHNEDACGHWQSDHQLCAVLADGAGGHGGGDVAAQLAVREFVTRFARSPSTQAAELGRMLHQINAALRGQRQPGTALADMHSTVVCMVLDFVGHRVHWAHAGDSRLYWFRDGHLHRRTNDHSLVQAMVEAGLLDADELRHHPQRSELRSALGVAPDELEVAAVDGADAVAPGDAFLLCTDGLWEYLDDPTLERLLADAADPRGWLDALCGEVAQATSHDGRHDNFSALAVWVDDAAGDETPDGGH